MQMSKSALFMLDSSDDVFVNATDPLLAQQWSTTATNDNSTGPDMYPDMPTIIMHMSLTMGLAIGGNLLLIFVIIRSNTAVRRRITPVQMLILNTCTADLLFALITIMPTLINTATFPRFHGPNWLCKTVRYLQMIPMYASPFLLVAISADRYQAICRPLANLKTDRYRRPAVFACVAWLLAFMLSTPQLFIFEIMHGDCLANYSDTWQHQAYAIGFNTAAWLLPSIVAGTFYFCVCRAVWYSSLSHDAAARPRRSASDKKQRAADTAKERECRNSLMIPSVHGEQNSNSSDYVNKLRTSCTYRKQTNENERKRAQTVKLTLTIVACNFLLWSPFCITNVVYALFPDFLSTQLTTYVMILGNVNSCVNPWIYVLFNRAQVRRACCARKGDEHLRTNSRMERSLTVLSSSCRRNMSGTNSSYSMATTTHLLPSDRRPEHLLHRNSSQWSRRTAMTERTTAYDEEAPIAQRYMVTAISDISLNYIDSESTA